MKRLSAIICGVFLSSCLTTAPSLSIDELFIQGADGSVVPYTEAIGGLPEASWTDKGLPLYRIWVGALPEEAKWMAAYDADGDETLTPPEMTVAWLVKTAEVKTKETLSPTSLVAFGKTASLVAQAQTQTITALSLSASEERSVRKVLDGTEAGAGLAEATAEAMAATGQASGGDGGAGGGSGGGSGAGGGGSGSGDGDGGAD